MFRGGSINLNQPLEMVRQVLSGDWVEYEKNGWHIVSCPLFTVMEKVCEEGTALLPLTVWKQTFADIVWDGGNTKQMVKPGSTSIVIDGQSSFVRITIYGQGDK
jgi:hypothetical protein